MEVIKHKAVTPAMLVSTTAVETYANWAAGTTYAKHARVVEGILGVYESLVNSNVGLQPSTNPASWVRVGPTNAQAMFDTSVSTQTTSSSPLTVVVDTGAITSLALLGLVGSTVTLTGVDTATSTTIFTETRNLEGSVVASWSDYFFEPFQQLADVVFFDLPQYANTRVTIQLSGSGAVSIGHLTFGLVYDLGDTQYSPTAGIADYSVKETDAYGETVFTVRNFSKRLSAKVLFANSQLNKVQNLLYSLRATPCVWIGTREPGFEPLIVFGFYKDFSTDIAYPYHSFCSLEIEGLA